MAKTSIPVTGSQNPNIEKAVWKPKQVRNDKSHEHLSKASQPPNPTIPTTT